MRKLWLLVGWAILIAIIALSLMPVPELDLSEGRDKWSHFLAYGTLMFWFCALYPAWGAQLGLGLAFAAMGVSLEYLQGLTGYRSYDVADMAANGMGVALGWMLARTPMRGVIGWADRKIARA